MYFDLTIVTSSLIYSFLFINKHRVADVDVIEFHEAFAGQVLANIAAMESEKFAKERLPSGKIVGYDLNASCHLFYR